MAFYFTAEKLPHQKRRKKKTAFNKQLARIEMKALKAQ
jgi:hypothetical protein